MHFVNGGFILSSPHNINNKNGKKLSIKEGGKKRKSTHKTETPMAQDAPPVLPKQKLK